GRALSHRACPRPSAHGDLGRRTGPGAQRHRSRGARSASGPPGPRRRPRRRPGLLRPAPGARPATVDRAPHSGEPVTAFARVRTYGSLVAFAHTVFALPFAASAVVLALARPHAALRPWRVAAMLACMVCARTSAMAFN